METDVIMNGQAHGEVASVLLQNNFDPGALRPYVENDGRTYVTVNGQRRLVTNAPATLRKDQWLEMDNRIIEVARDRLNFVSDLRSSNLEYVIPNGMGKTILEFEKSGDITDADISMDGIREAQRDRPEYKRVSLPLPIIHKDFSFTAREIQVSRSGPNAAPLDLFNAEAAARKVAEEAEKLALGTSTQFSSYGGASVYGLTDFPDRNTKTITTPTGANNATIVQEFIQMREALYADHYYGPFMIYVAPSWDEFLDLDYSSTKGDNTLRDRIKAIRGINDVKTLDYLPTKTAVMVQMTSDVVREVVGMDIVTLQWESHGGMMLNFKVMAIMVPQLRSDYDGRCGINHGTYA